MKNFLVLFVLFLSPALFAQELNCKVELNSAQVQGVDASVFQKLKKDIYDFVNSRKWTSDAYAVEEKIECSFFITVKSATVDRYEATLQVQSFRPVFGSTYKSMLLDINDNDFNFSYTPSQTLDFSDNEYISNLTSVLAFYANVILAFDYDSFALKGGTDYFAKAQNIINNAQNIAEVGWRSTIGSKNRYWLMENLMNEVYEPIRVCTYKYHRLGLDVMSKETDKGRQALAEGLLLLEQVTKRKPNSYSIKVFFDAKNQEIINIYRDESVSDKKTMMDYLSRIDPGNSSRYAKIMQK